MEIIVLQGWYDRYRIVRRLHIGQNAQNDPLLAFLDVHHTELLLHGLYFLGGNDRLPDLTLDLLGQLIGGAAVQDLALFLHNGLAGDEFHIRDHMSGNNGDLIKGDT